MSSSNILLVLISGLGVLHGLFLAIFLWSYKGNRTSNKLLSLLLLALSFRVGKSVFLEFTENLQIQFIFTGLAALMIIGPLFYLYCLSVAKEDFKFKKSHILHFIPALSGILFGLWINKELMNSIPKVAFISMFIFYYGHYLFYLFISYRHISATKNEKSSNAYSLLRLLFLGLTAIWFVYVLNLFDDLVPYIFGPILYTVVAYSISYIVIKNGYLNTSDHTKYKTTSVADEQISQIFSKVLNIVVDEKQFKNSEITLKTLSAQLKLTTQTLSMVINKKAETNFNNFINRYRVEEAIRMFKDPQFDHHTISAIAFESGFNSISSFNVAFKKYAGNTPSVYRKKLTERSVELPE